MSDLEKKRTTDITTFRLDTELLQSLKLVAKKERLSLNTLVSHIFTTHLGWDLHAAEVGWVVMLKSGLIEIIKHLDKETICKIAKKSSDAGAKEIALYMRGKYGVEEWISIFRDRAKVCGFNVKEYKENNKTKFVMHHDMGENWSLFFKTYYENIFDDLGVRMHSDYTENSIVIELENVS